MTRHDAPLKRRAAARALSKCGGSAWPGGRALRLQWRGAPTRTAHAAVARKRSPARLCMMMAETPLPTLALGRSAKRLVHRASRAAQSARRLRLVFDNDMPTTPRGNARVIGGGTCRRPRARSAHAIGAERAARGHDWAAAGARARSAHAIGAERVARGVDGSQRLRRPGRPGTGAQRPRHAAPCAERRARNARRRSGSPQAPGVQSAHATGAERVARGGASWHAGTASTRTRWEAFAC